MDDPFFDSELEEFEELEETCAQPRFSSPRTELSPEEFEQLERCIIAANNLLQTLGNPRQGNNEAGEAAGGEAEGNGNNRSLQLSFRRMRGTMVQIRLKDGKERDLLGTIQDAGLNFLQLDRLGEIILIPFSRILTMTRSAHQSMEEHTHHEGELRNIDACFRRSLVLDFGNVVACSPELTNLFFGINLSQKVTALTGCDVVIHTANEQEWRGTLLSADEDALQLCIKKQSVRNIELDQISTLRLT